MVKLEPNLDRYFNLNSCIKVVQLIAHNLLIASQALRST